MIINWYGLSCFRLQNNGTSLLIDPLPEASGLKMPRMQNDITLFTQAGLDKKASGFAISSPGEYEVKSIFIYGLAGENGEAGKIIYLIEAEGIRLAHLGSVKQAKFSQAQLERLDNVDILFLPVGGGDGLSSKQAAEVISALEPRLVVPMNYQIPGLKFKLENLEDFKKEVGGNFETVDKLKISKKDLPEEETRLVVIEPSK